MNDGTKAGRRAQGRQARNANHGKQKNPKFHVLYVSAIPGDIYGGLA
jgi:hypothetical protein